MGWQEKEREREGERVNPAPSSRLPEEFPPAAAELLLRVGKRSERERKKKHFSTGHNNQLLTFDPFST